MRPCSHLAFAQWVLCQTRDLQDSRAPNLYCFQVTTFMGVRFSSNRKLIQDSFLQGRAELSSSWVWVGLSDSLLINRIWQKWDVTFRVRLWQDWVCVLGELSLSLGVVPHTEGLLPCHQAPVGQLHGEERSPASNPMGELERTASPRQTFAQL